MIIIDAILAVLIALLFIGLVKMEMSARLPLSDKLLHWLSYVLVFLATWIVTS